MSKNDRLGKYLTFILRHKPEHLGLELDQNGWLNLDELLEAVKIKEKFEISKDKVINEVNVDEKGRFQLSPDGKSIRCLQGHTFENINIQYEKKDPTHTLYHGTKISVLNKIKEKGLLAFNREYVHLIADKKIALENGERWREKEVALLSLNINEMVKDGVEFFVSENNVWLVKGVVLPKYIENIEISKNKLFIKPKMKM